MKRILLFLLLFFNFSFAANALSPGEKKEPGSKGNLIWEISAFVVVTSGVVVLGRKRRRKRSRN